MTILVTGGAGFIGTNFVLDWIGSTDEPVINFDKLTYAGNLGNLRSIADNLQHKFVQGDITDQQTVVDVFNEHQPRAVVHFAAESHVDRSIHGPDEFIQTNVVGTHTLLAAALEHWQKLKGSAKDDFRFINVSTDEVFGSLALMSRRATRTPATRRTAPTRLPRQQLTILSAHISRLSDCRSLRLIAPITTAPSSFLKN